MHCNGSMLLVDERLISKFSLLPWQGQHCDSSCRISLPLFSIRLNHSSPKMLINFCWINSFKWICQGNALPERVTACKNYNCCKDIKVVNQKRCLKHLKGIWSPQNYNPQSENLLVKKGDSLTCFWHLPSFKLIMFESVSF